MSYSDFIKSLKASALLAVALLVGAATLTSCDNTVLSASDAKKALKKEILLEDSVCVKDFATGYYEVNDAELLQLAQLQAAGMITYTAQQVIEKKKRYFSYYYSSGYYYEDIPHVFAQVDLTEKGLKYVVTNVPTQRKDYLEDMGLNKKDKEQKAPDYMEATPEVKYDKSYTDSIASIVDPSDDLLTDEDYYEATRPNTTTQEQPSPYEIHLSKCNSTSHNVLTGKFKIAKVKNIFCPKEYADRGEAKCTYILEFTKRTPFGWVLGSLDEGDRKDFNADLVRYEDGGWEISHKD